MKTVKQRVLHTFFVCLVASFLCASTRLSAAPLVLYQPQFIYKGEYIPTAIYYKTPGSSIWQSMSKSNNYLNVVRCPAALKALDSVGQWPGHLKEDGTCGSLAEPSLFAIGNRINYDLISTGEGISK